MEYIIKSTAILSLFYLLYVFILQKDTFFQSIRVYFLAGLLCALTLPLIVITKYVEINTVAWTNTAINSSISAPEHSTYSFTDVLFGVYFLGVVFFVTRMVWQISSLIWFLKTNTKEKIGKYYYIKTTKNITPYSFFNYIVYNEKMFHADELSQIIVHEKTHANQLHSADIILSQLVTILNWFNPLAWLYHKSIQKNLEFIADECTTQLTQTKKEYQYLLLKTTTPQHQMALTSNFYNSLIKKRINMLQKNRSHNASQLKFALIIPVLIAFVFTFNTKTIAQEKQNHFVVKKLDVHVEVIDKDFQKSDLNSLKSKFLEKGIILKYSGLKYNASNEIIAINLSVKNSKGSKAKLSRSGTEAIQPIHIKIDSSNNTIAMGDVSPPRSGDFVFHSDKGKNIQIIEEKIEGGHTVIIDEDGKKTTHDLKGDNMVFITKDDQGNIEKKIFAIKKDGTQTANVWVSKNGDSLKTNRVKVMTWSSDDDINATENVIIDLDTDKKVKHKVIQLHGSDTDSKPLIIIDGKVSTNDEMEQIAPNNIKSINVLKGDGAVKKFGDKAKGGAIEITTKK